VEPKKYQKGQTITGDARKILAANVKYMYVNEKLAIRAICAKTGRSYGAIHRMLREEKVSFRPVGWTSRGQRQPLQSSASSQTNRIELDA
jgi:hypothetical protein